MEKRLLWLVICIFYPTFDGFSKKKIKTIKRIQTRVTPLSHKNPLSRGTIWRHSSKPHTFDESVNSLLRVDWEWTSSLFCWLPLFYLCCWPLFGDSLLSFNIANCRLLFALLFHQSLNWKVGSAWPSSGRKGDVKAGQSPGKWIQTVALKQYLICFVFSIYQTKFPATLVYTQKKINK